MLLVPLELLVKVVYVEGHLPDGQTVRRNLLVSHDHRH